MAARDCICFLNAEQCFIRVRLIMQRATNRFERIPWMGGMGGLAVPFKSHIPNAIINVERNHPVLFALLF